MSIPKVINYCWFGRGEKSELMKKCIESWKIHCPDYEIIEWNEDNFDVNFCSYTAKAFRERKWAYLSDAARLKIIYDNGGLYLDTDAELRHSLDPLLDNEAWFGYATDTEIGTGVGFGAVAGNSFVKQLLAKYESFDEKSSYGLCTKIDAETFKEYYPNFAADHKVDQTENGVHIINNIYHYAIHHYTNSWMTPKQRIFTAALNSTPTKIQNKIRQLRNKH